MFTIKILAFYFFVKIVQTLTKDQTAAIKSARAKHLQNMAKLREQRKEERKSLGWEVAENNFMLNRAKEIFDFRQSMYRIKAGNITAADSPKSSTATQTPQAATTRLQSPAASVAVNTVMLPSSSSLSSTGIPVSSTIISITPSAGVPSLVSTTLMTPSNILGSTGLPSSTPRTIIPLPTTAGLFLSGSTTGPLLGSTKSAPLLISSSDTNLPTFGSTGSILGNTGSTKAVTPGGITGSNPAGPLLGTTKVTPLLTTSEPLEDNTEDDTDLSTLGIIGTSKVVSGGITGSNSTVVPFSGTSPLSAVTNSFTSTRSNAG